MFKKVEEGHETVKDASPILHDYMAAYLDFYEGHETGFKKAREIAKQYENYPVIAWRILFTDILDTLAEYDGVNLLEDFEIDQDDEEKKEKNYKKSKNLEPQFHCSLEAKKIQMEYLNVREVEVKYYVIDPEVLFSRTPFLMNNTEEFSFTKPIAQYRIQLDKALKTKEVPIEEDFVAKNVVIEVAAAGKSHYLTYYSTSLKVSIIENYGELKVTDTAEQPLSRVYVKAFAKYKNGTDKFFKDGYTDIRGKFEYAQTNSSKLKDITKFALLIKSDEQGAITREVKPPPNVDHGSADADLGGLKPQQMKNYMARQRMNKAKR